MKKSKRRIPYVHERDGKMYVRVPYRDGQNWKTKEKRVADTDEALRVIQQFKEELGLHGAKAFDGDRMTFMELMSQYKRAHPDKPRWYLDPLEKFFGDRRIRTITYGDLKQFKQARESVKKSGGGDRKPATIHREVEQLRGVLLYALRHGWLKVNPFGAGPPLISKSDEEQRDRVPSPAEEAAILAHCVEPREHLRGLIIATRDTGLRKSALQSLTWSMVDWENKLLRIPKGNIYKKRPAAIGISTRLIEELKRLWEKSDQKPETRIFGDRQDFKRSYKTACRLAGVTGLRFNDFRHGFATDLMEAGIPRHLAMKVSGHTQVDTHEIYANVDDRLALQVAAALDRLHASRSADSTVRLDITESPNFIN